MTALRHIILPALLVLTASTATADASDPVHEHIASLIADIDSYVAWPEAKSAPDRPFFVAVLGESPLTVRVKELNRKKLADGRKIKVRVVRHDLLPSNAHILLIAAADEAISVRLLEKLKGTATLTVTTGEVDLPTILRVDQIENDGRLKVRTILDIKAAGEEKLDIKKKLRSIAVTEEP